MGDTAPCDNVSIAPTVHLGQVTFVGAYPCIRSHRTTASHEAWTRRDSNPHLLPSQGAVFPLHHGPEATLQLKLFEVILRNKICSNLLPKRENSLRLNTVTR